MKALVFALALAGLGCGARTELSQAGGGSPVSNLACARQASGAKAWQVSLPGDMTFTGPWAVDGDGTTYYLGTDAPSYPVAYTIAAIDRCGVLRWQSALQPVAYLDGAEPDVVVSGDRVLFKWGTVDAFDRASGAHLWNADLDAYLGEKLALDDGAEIGPLAVAADGTAFLSLTSSVQAAVLSVDTAGNLATAAQIQGDTGDISGFLLDADDNLDTLYNSVGGAIVASYTRKGSWVFTRAFACNVGILGPLAAGSSFVVMQSGPCAMDLHDHAQLSPPLDGSAQSVTIDAAGALYYDGNVTLASEGLDASPRWTRTESEQVVSSPLLATGSQIFTARLPMTIAQMPGPVSIVANDTATGAELARYPTDVVVPGGLIPVLSTLVTPAAQVVFGVGNTVTAIAVDQTADATAQWPTAAGGPDRRNAALGR